MPGLVNPGVRVFVIAIPLSSVDCRLLSQMVGVLNLNPMSVLKKKPLTVPFYEDFPLAPWLLLLQMFYSTVFETFPYYVPPSTAGRPWVRLGCLYGHEYLWSESGHEENFYT